MQILALSRRLPGTTPEQLAALAADEARVAHELLVQGLVRSIHMCPERPGSMVVLECADLDAARAALQRLPMVRDGLITFDLSRMLPYTGYEALFHPSQRGTSQ
jgi:muconolactone delta-isomerase